MSDTEQMVSVPRSELARLQENMDPHRGAVAWGIVCDLLAHAGAQHQGEPVAHLCKSDGAKWLQYGSKVGDPWKPGEVQVTPLYTRSDAGEVERLAILLRQMQVKHSQERDNLRAQLAEAIAVLDHISGDYAGETGKRIQRCLSASAEPTTAKQETHDEMRIRHKREFDALDGSGFHYQECRCGTRGSYPVEVKHCVCGKPFDSAEPSAPKRETCKSCHGEGVIHTGVEESPTTLCNRCDGSGNEPSAPVEIDEDEEMAAFQRAGWSKNETAAWLGWKTRAALSGSAEPSAPKCETCKGNGVVGWQRGQTPEQFEQGADECADCLGTGHAHNQGMAVPGTCTTCNGLGHVPDGAITGVGDVEFENGPVECIKDCPDCKGAEITSGDQLGANSDCQLCNDTGSIITDDFRFKTAPCPMCADKKTAGEAVAGLMEGRKEP